MHMCVSAGARLWVVGFGARQPFASMSYVHLCMKHHCQPPLPAKKGTSAAHSRPLPAGRATSSAHSMPHLHGTAACLVFELVLQG